MTSRDQHAIVTLDIPASALCGIDLASFTTTPQFQGIKHVPAGWHFIYTSLTASLSIRHGTWLYIPSQATSRETTTVKNGPSDAAVVVIIKRWDAQREELVDEKDPTALAQLRASAATIWRERLTHYGLLLGGSPGKAGSSGGVINDAVLQDKLRDWRVLTDCISAQLLSRVTGGDWNNWRLSSASSAARDVDEIPGLPSDIAAAGDDGSEGGSGGKGGGHGGELRFLPVDLKRTWRSGAIGRERTEAAQDRSWALGDLLRNHCAGNTTTTARNGDDAGQESHAQQPLAPPRNATTQTQLRNSDTEEEEERENYILGELQLTFLTILTLANYSCMEQWKRLLTLLFTCRAAISARPRLFARVLRLLEVQLRHSSTDVEGGGLFDMSVDDDEGGGSNLLKKLLKTFRRNLEELLLSAETMDQKREGMRGDQEGEVEGGVKGGGCDGVSVGVEGQVKEGLREVQRAFESLERFLAERVPGPDTRSRTVDCGGACVQRRKSGRGCGALWLLWLLPGDLFLRSMLGSDRVWLP